MTTTATTYHVPVLLHESIEGLNISPSGVYVDATFGGGGHSREILRRLSEDGHLYGFDQDEDALKNAPDAPQFTFVRSNFRYLKNWMRYYGVGKIDGLLADLGVSSHHFDDAERGFSFRFDAPLDMRMNKGARITAAEVVKGYGESRLADVFYVYGELRNARRLAAEIVRQRQQKPISTTAELMDVAEKAFPQGRAKKDMARVFQALRIEVNHEMEALHDLLTAATELIRPGGRLVVISYHSLEDRMVKNLVRTGNADGHSEDTLFGRIESPFKAVNSKVIVPDDDEQQRNPRSRSARLRIAERR